LEEKKLFSTTQAKAYNDCGLEGANKCVHFHHGAPIQGIYGELREGKFRPDKEKMGLEAFYKMRWCKSMR
ncbi:hypothetical protein Ancab_004167, partial [Ancistrocladus abbreviatus]